MNLVQQIERCYSAGMVRRYHTMPSMHREQNVAEHTFGMLMLTTVLHPSPSAALLTAITHHDGGEFHTGDVLYPFKARPEIEKILEDEELKARIDHGMMGRFQDHLTGPEMQWLECVDKLEALLFALHQIKSGNLYFKEVSSRVYDWLVARQYSNTMPVELMVFFNALKEAE